jgi:hypothetical protein
MGIVGENARAVERGSSCKKPDEEFSGGGFQFDY